MPRRPKNSLQKRASRSRQDADSSSDEPYTPAQSRPSIQRPQSSSDARYITQNISLLTFSYALSTPVTFFHLLLVYNSLLYTFCVAAQV